MDRRNTIIKIGHILDGLIIALGIAIVVLAVLIVMQSAKNKVLFVVLFGVETLINIVTAIKSHLADEKLRFVVSLIISALALAITIFSFVVFVL